MSKNYADGVVKRLEHVKSHIEGGYKVDQLVNNIENSLGNPRACLMSLSAHAEAKAMYAWFAENDLGGMKKWCYTAAGLDQKWYTMQVDTSGPRAKMLQLLKPLLSDDDSMVAWFAHYDAAYDLARVEKHKTVDFWAYQAVLALRGEWDRLAARCDKVLSDPPTQAAEKKYLIDHEFYLALARKDVVKMEEILAQITTAKAVGARGNDESGYTDGMISTAGVIYAKMAWRHGLPVKVDSPYVPQEWLPVDRTARYDAEYRFLAGQSI